MCLDWLFHIGLIDKSEREYVDYLSDLPPETLKCLLEGLIPILKPQTGKCIFSTKEQYDWCIALLVQGLMLPIDYVETMYSVVDVYRYWLLTSESRPEYLEKGEETDEFLKKLAFMLVLLYKPRPYSATGEISTAALSPEKESEMTTQNTNESTHRHRFNLFPFINWGLRHGSNKTQPLNNTSAEEQGNKSAYSFVSRYTELLKQVLQIFTVLTRSSTSMKYSKSVMRTVIKCVFGISDFCLKQGNKDEEMLDYEKVYRELDPMWGQVGTALSDLIMRNFFEVWFRTETVDDKMWGSLISRIKFWTHRPEVVDDLAAAVIAFTRRSISILYDEDPRVGTKSLVVEMGMNRFIQLDLTSSYTLFTWPRLINLVREPYKLNGDSFQAAMQGLSAIVKEFLELDYIEINTKLDGKYQGYIQAPCNKRILDIVGNKLFEGIFKTSSEGYRYDQGRAMACSMLCSIFSRPTHGSYSEISEYVDLFYTMINEAFKDSTQLQMVLVFGKNLLATGLPNFKAFMWHFVFGVRQILPNIAPMMQLAVNLSKLKICSSYIMSVLLSISQLELKFEQIESIKNSKYDGRSKRSGYVENQQNVTPTGSLYPSARSIYSTFSLHGHDFTSMYNESIFDSIGPNIDETDPVSEIVNVLLPDLIESIKNEKNEDALNILINSALMVLTQSNEFDRDTFVEIINLCVNEISGLNDDFERDCILIRMLRQSTVFMNEEIYETFMEKIFEDLCDKFIHVFSLRQEMNIEALGDMLACIRLWATMNSWMLHKRQIVLKLSAIWKLVSQIILTIREKYCESPTPICDRHSSYYELFESEGTLYKIFNRQNYFDNFEELSLKVYHMYQEQLGALERRYELYDESEIEFELVRADESENISVEIPKTNQDATSKKESAVKKQPNVLGGNKPGFKPSEVGALEAEKPQQNKERNLLSSIQRGVKNKKNALVENLDNLKKDHFKKAEGLILPSSRASPAANIEDLFNAGTENKPKLSECELMFKRFFGTIDISERILKNFFIVGLDFFSYIYKTLSEPVQDHRTTLLETEEPGRTEMLESYYVYVHKKSTILRLWLGNNPSVYKLECLNPFGSNTYAVVDPSYKSSNNSVGGQNGTDSNSGLASFSCSKTSLDMALDNTEVNSRPSLERNLTADGVVKNTCSDTSSDFTVNSRPNHSRKLPHKKPIKHNSFPSYKSSTLFADAETSGSPDLRLFASNNRLSGLFDTPNIDREKISTQNTSSLTDFDTMAPQDPSHMFEKSRVLKFFSELNSTNRVLPHRATYSFENSSLIHHNADFISTFNSIKRTTPQITIDVGFLHLTQSESGSTRDFDKNTCNFSKLFQNLKKYGNCDPDEVLLLENRTFLPSLSFGYKLNYFISNESAPSNANIYIVCVDNYLISSMQLHHVVMRAKQFGLIGVPYIDSLLKPRDSFDSIPLSSYSRINDYGGIQSNVSTHPYLRIFFFIGHVADSDDKLVQCKIAIYGSGSVGLNTGPIFDDCIVHIDSLHFLLSLTIIELHNSLSRRTNSELSHFDQRKLEINRLVARSTTETLKLY